MEVRGYNARYRRTQYRELKVKWTDLFFLLVCGIIFGLLIIYFAQHIYLGVFAYSDLLLTRGA
jgi:energy-coupling factor transporter transmembrane protein EcfT